MIPILKIGIITTLHKIVCEANLGYLVFSMFHHVLIFSIISFSSILRPDKHKLKSPYIHIKSDLTFLTNFGCLAPLVRKQGHFFKMTVSSSGVNPVKSIEYEMPLTLSKVDNC